MNEHPSVPADIPLGQHTEYLSVYTPSLLCPIPRAESRRGLSLQPDALPFGGVDLWTGYELSWLDARGKPLVAIGEFTLPCDSEFLIESKSFKLYLNSLNQTRFDSLEALKAVLVKDLSAAAGGAVAVQVSPLTHAALPHLAVAPMPAEHLDELEVDIVDYHPNADLLALDASGAAVTESLYSDLLKTNCPVTGQPDWASVYIRYSGPQIERESLLKYIVSFREHQDFHEHCVERMFTDILARCQPQALTVYARYTRRGGLDINPFRTNCGELPTAMRLVRQ